MSGACLVQGIVWHNGHRQTFGELVAIESAPQAEVDTTLKKDENARFDPYAQYEFVPAPDQRTATPDVDIPYADIPPANLTPTAPQRGAGKDTTQLFFGADSMTTGGARISPKIVPWAPGEAPVVLASRGDPDIKQSALSPSLSGDENKGGESVASKGEVTGVDQRPRTPAERLALSGTARAKAERCLANAVYFEARGESVRGQIAVAQVVMNRVFSPFYPNDVCGVVYQNSGRHLACQFTFACDGIPDIVTEPDAWERAKRIAHDMLDGKLDDGSYFAKKDRYLLTSIPRLADDLTQHREGRARRMVLKLWLRRLVPSWVALKSEGHKGTDASLILISLVLLTIIARSFISQTTKLIDSPAPPTLYERGLSRTGPIVGGRTGSLGQQSPAQPSAGAIDRFSLSMDNRDLVATVTRTTSGRTSYGAMGEVRNKSTKTFHFVMIKVEFYDRWGRVVGTLMTEGNRDEYVLPGRAIAFTVQRNGKLDYATAKASIAYSVEVK